MRRQVESDLLAGRLDLLYASPERFAMPEFLALLKRSRVSFVAIDEAHCISEWGHDFRPDYLNLASIVDGFPDVPVTAFTATATHRVQEDIIAKLRLRSPFLARASFNRPNLYYKVLPKQQPSEQILRFVRGQAGQPGIIYRTTRKAVEQTADMLTRHGISALPYHAGLNDQARVRNQDAFNRDEVDVIVATIAFGMGIDKSNVRYVLHGDLPKHIESYYQETGRAGRDGEPAHCLLLFGYGDIPQIRFFIGQLDDQAERSRLTRCLNDMINFATVHACRRQQLLRYFGEDLDLNESKDRCCDICAGEVERIDATRDAQIVLSAISRTRERFGIYHIISIVVGDATDRIKQLGHDRIKTFAAGKDQDKRHWRLVIDHLLAQGLVRQSGGDYPVLELEAAARDVLFNGRPVFILRSRRQPPKSSRRTTDCAAPSDKTLFEQLRALRKRLAAEEHVPPYVIFNDRTLHEMAREYPVTEPALLQITGVGEHRLAKYGNAFLTAIRDYRQTPGPHRRSS
jgi:ATP-dependent DNA helicase RecQ